MIQTAYNSTVVKQPTVPAFSGVRIVYNYVWNLLRRPFVWRWQKRVVAIAEKIKIDLINEVFPTLYDNSRARCSECAFHYQFLKAQPFTSQIELALTKNACAKHVRLYHGFWVKHKALFDESHELSDKICGFRSLNLARD